MRSLIFTRPLASKSTLSLFMSRWMMLCECRCPRPLQVCPAFPIKNVTFPICTDTHLKADTSNLILFELVILDHICKRTALHVLHDDPEFVSLDKIRF